MNTHPLRTLALLALSLCAFAAIAGPPLLCHPFDTAGAPSLAWGGSRWNQPRADYDLRTLSTNTEALLKADTPVIARMETLRRAAIYSSRDAAIATQLLSRLDARIPRATTTTAQSLARFDSGYFTETLQDVVRLQGYDMPGFGKADTRGLNALLAGRDGDAQVDAAIKLRPNDPAMRFAAALIAAADSAQPPTPPTPASRAPAQQTTACLRAIFGRSRTRCCFGWPASSRLVMRLGQLENAGT